MVVTLHKCKEKQLIPMSFEPFWRFCVLFSMGMPLYCSAWGRPHAGAALMLQVQSTTRAWLWAHVSSH